MDFFIADEHWYHTNILLWRDDKARRNFFSLDQMHNYMKKQHNSVVGPNDTVYHLGDWSFARSVNDCKHILRGYNGRHILILGNHDNFNPFGYIDCGFESVHTSLQYGLFTLIHDPAVAGVKKNERFIHGHTHGLGLNLAPNTYCVSVELHDYTPVSIETIINHFVEQNHGA